jgi:hypothetical protein
VSTEFFKIAEELSDDNDKREYFVLYNPPNSNRLLKKTVEKYNMQTQSIDTIKKYRYVEREFFRETPCLTRNYEEGRPYPEAIHSLGVTCRGYYAGLDRRGQHIENHIYSTDFLMHTCHVIHPHEPNALDYAYRIKHHRATFSTTKFFESPAPTP